MNDMKNRDFIIISLNPWNTPLNSTSKYVARELSKQNRVLYVNPALDRKTMLTKKKDPMLSKHIEVTKGKAAPLEKIAPNLWNLYPDRILESVNWLPSTKVFSWFNYLNNKRIAASIRSTLKELQFSNYILINDKDLFRGFYLKELLKPQLYIYYDRDYILGVDYWKKHGKTMEPLLVKKSDLIVTHSDYLMSLIKSYNNNIYNVGSGIDLSLFSSEQDYPPPKELAGVNTPVIGYVGALTSKRLDRKAFEKIADQRPDWTMLLIGPEDEAFKNSRLHRMKNVIFCGKKDIKEIPRYIHAMDVCLNLQIINDITIGNYPLKIDEYLAMGKPVVATRTIGMRPFEDHVLMAEPGGDYVQLIEKALQDTRGKTKRIELAKSHSWENILNNVYNAVENTMMLQHEPGY